MLTALYNNGRIQNKRYCFVDYDSQSRVPGQSLETLYKSCEGGAVVIRYGNETDSDGEYARRDDEIISALSEIALKYKNSVLTIICLPCVSNKVKDLFLTNFGSTSFVEVFEDIVYKDDAQRYLKNKAKQFKIRADKTLLDLSGISENGYTATDLNCVFDEWYDKKLRNTVYPQYKDAQTAKAKLKKLKPRVVLMKSYKSLLVYQKQKSYESGETRTFRAFVKEFIKDYKPESISKENDLWLSLKESGEFVVRKGRTGKGISDLSKEDLLHYNLLCFLNIVRFWDEFNEIRDINTIKAPIIIKLPDNCNFDLDCLIDRIKKMKSAVIVVH